KDEFGDKPPLLQWQAGDVVDPKVGNRYSRLRVTQRANITWVNVTGDAYGLRDLFGAAAGLTFSPRPKDAPVVHFFGPLSLRLLVTEGGARNLVATVGTPGLGKGTFADVTWYLILRAHPVVSVEAEYPDGSRHQLEETIGETAFAFKVDVG